MQRWNFYRLVMSAFFICKCSFRWSGNTQRHDATITSWPYNPNFFSVTYMYIKNHSSTCTDNNDDGNGDNTLVHTKHPHKHTHTAKVTFDKKALIPHTDSLSLSLSFIFFLLCSRLLDPLNSFMDLLVCLVVHEIYIWIFTLFERLLFFLLFVLFWICLKLDFFSTLHAKCNWLFTW